MTTLPAGWMLVPIEPTAEMLEAARRAPLPAVMLDSYSASENMRNKAAYAAMLAAAHTPPASAQDDAKEAVMEAIAAALGDAYDCMRVWSAWGVGTMSQDDFRLVADDAGRLGELADAAIAAMRPAPAAGDARMPVLNIEAAAKAMAECMDYPWAHMPEQGHATMREHAQTVIRAASQQQEG